MQTMWRIFLGLSALWTIYCLVLLPFLWLFASGPSASRIVDDLKIHGVLVDAAPDGTRKLALSAYRSGGGAAGWSHREVIVCAAPKAVGAGDPERPMVAQLAVRVSGPPAPRYRWVDGVLEVDGSSVVFHSQEDFLRERLDAVGVEIRQAKPW